MHDPSTASGAPSQCPSPTRYLSWCQALSLTILLMGTATVSAQPTGRWGPLQPGEAFVTRFSGVVDDGRGNARIDPDGVVGSIMDLRAPQQPPQGQHWIDEPQRAQVRAGEVGQVFGVAVDDANAPNIYLAATSAFGLHLVPGGAAWMVGMWGQGGGPGTVYKLDATDGYRPHPFAEIRYKGRANTGAALGNIAFDPHHDQLFVSDLETGMIHRLRRSDGADLGYFDHGTEGRPGFLDVPSGESRSLRPIAFDPISSARREDCRAGSFEWHPECWNFAASGRRVWGVGVWRHPETREVRLYYAVWSGPAFGNTNWSRLSEDEKRNSVWSVRLDADGDFDPSDVRREFLLPDFFVSEEDIARSGYSHPVSDITFSNCGERPVMLVAERGGIRNLGLGEEYAFSRPHEARALRYELDRAGAWRPVGRYDVGFYDRREEGQPFLRANCSGGIAFGPGYDEEAWVADKSRTDEFVWITGDALCSPKGPCLLPDFEGEVAEEGQDAIQPAAQEDLAGAIPDDSEVHGVQGLPETAFEEIAPTAAFTDHPQETDAYPASGPGQAFLVDADVNVDAAGGLIESELLRNDATRIGDIAIYQPCPAPRAVRSAYLLPVPSGEPPYLVDHPRSISHARIASHGSYSSHSRFGSHNPYWSHSRFGSHNTYWSHSLYGSHSTFWSHNRTRSHSRRESHNRWASHSVVQSHFRIGSHSLKASHSRIGSHSALLSHSRTGSHNRRISHTRLGSHNLTLSHGRVRSHTTELSHSLKGSHNLALSHSKQKSHSAIISKGPVHTLLKSQGHNAVLSKGEGHSVAKSKGPGHSFILSKGPAHTVQKSVGAGHTVALSKGAHTLAQSKGHNPVISKGPVHTTVQSKGPAHTVDKSVGGGHTVALSKGAHTLAQSKGHSTVLSKATKHNVVESKGPPPKHNPNVSKAVQEPVPKKPLPKLPPEIKQPPVIKQPGPKVLTPPEPPKVKTIPEIKLPPKAKSIPSNEPPKSTQPSPVIKPAQQLPKTGKEIPKNFPQPKAIPPKPQSEPEAPGSKVLDKKKREQLNE